MNMTMNESLRVNRLQRHLEPQHVPQKKLALQRKLVTNSGQWRPTELHRDNDVNGRRDDRKL